jgi:hypothetical protein
MTKPTWLQRSRSLLVFCWLSLSAAAWAQAVIHHGPGLEVEVQRGDERLPMALVNRLRQGDRLLVRPDSTTLSKDDWVLLLAQVSPTGNKVTSQSFEVSDLKGSAEMEITADNQVAVIMLAPQLRNLFGLYTSLSESATLLNEVLRADPQRFYELQKVDQINQAIQAISQGLTKRMAGSKPQEAIQAARDLALKFGIRNIDPGCLRNDTVNTECVATQIVINKDFSLPSNSDLNAMFGNKKAVDFNSFLLSNLRIFSEASDYLSNKYRDSYDFAPTFGRRQVGDSRIELFSMARFRKGNIKTAYIYVPSWFSGQVPSLNNPSQYASCFSRGELPLQLQGKLPLVNYWHDWHMSVSDPQSKKLLGDATGLAFDPDTAKLSFDPLALDASDYPESNDVWVTLKAKFGFEPLSLAPMRMRLPVKDATQVLHALDGLNDMASGEQVQLKIRDNALAACVDAMTLTRPDGSPLVSSDHSHPAQLAVDLREIPPSDVQLSIQQVGASPLLLPLRVLQPRARITRIVHAQSDDSLSVTGTQLERIARIEVGPVTCSAETAVPHQNKANTLVMLCDGDIRDNAKLPDHVQVVHRNDEPAALRVPLLKAATQPRFVISEQAANAVVVSPSAKALQWGLSPTDTYMSEDSGLNLLLQAQAPYALVRGTYVLQLRFKDDAQTDSQPMSASLIADFAHNELRTRNPVNFAQAELPSVINPLEYRILHNPSGLASDWQNLPRQVLLLPELQDVTCSPAGDALWVQGKRLDLIDTVRVSADAEFQAAQLVSCPTGLCLSLPAAAADEAVTMRLRWIDQRLFKPKLPKASQACTSAVPN